MMALRSTEEGEMMARELITDSHLGFENQVRAAVDALGPRQMTKFVKEFPEWERWHADQYADDVDPEYSSWVADWIEQNTRMYWEDGDLWTR